MTHPGVLYIVATPIGNLDDISARALSVMKSVQVIAAEDTRHSQKLLAHFGIDKKLIPYHDHTNEKQIDMLLQRLADGEKIALVSDAGTPLISDPGYRIVKRAREQNITVVPIPGPSAPIAALSAAGLPTDRFSFEGFPPAKSGARIKMFERLVAEQRTMVFFESTHRIEDSLEDAIRVFGAERQAVIARELTKTFETFLSGSLADIARQIREDSNQKRGEFVLMLAGAEQEQDESGEVTIDIDALLIKLAKTLPTKQASSLASDITGLPKKDLYQRVLVLKGQA